MPPPSPLAISTSSLLRLVKEESSYHREHAEQSARIAKLEADLQAGNQGEDGNAEFALKQEVRGFFPPSLCSQSGRFRLACTY